MGDEGRGGVVREIVSSAISACLCTQAGMKAAGVRLCWAGCKGGVLFCYLPGLVLH